ncbi:hypothetical protein [Priestia koreensis]|uniref:Uncharacterized protein n=1 Tax=Priestia koreensis TaxID=284581 RepID=A0A0M0L5S4_9BACI|nr:hypothetical protein [Priestia koreensis]KOO46394.1 hypothetical protein AMD01_11195 [Priestia koreensis]
MSQIIDLNLLVPEDLQFKIGNDIYKIPTQPKYQKVLEFSVMQQKYAKTRNAQELEKALPEMVAFILNLDEEKSKMTAESVTQNLILPQMKIIMEKFTEELQKTANDPN